MLRQIIKFLVRCISAISAAGVLALFLPRIITAIHANNRIKTFDNVSPKRIAIVFGAGLWRDGSPTPVLRDRVTAAADLYFTGKVEKLYFSGDNRYVEYNEPGAMLRYALNLGVPREAVVLDFAGRSTYDTCYRAKYIFGIDEAILVTQNFHLPRALYICHVIGIDVVGVPADRSIFSSRSIIFWNLREVPATLNALWQVHISHPLPVMGEPEFIFPPQEAQ